MEIANKLNLLNVDRNTPMIFPPDLRDWVPENHPVHFKRLKNLICQDQVLSQNSGNW